MLCHVRVARYQRQASNMADGVLAHQNRISPLRWHPLPISVKIGRCNLSITIFAGRELADFGNRDGGWIVDLPNVYTDTHRGTPLHHNAHVSTSFPTIRSISSERNAAVCASRNLHMYSCSNHHSPRFDRSSSKKSAEMRGQAVAGTW